MILRIGSSVKFVRWIRTRDRFFPEILHGRYLGSTAEGWNVDADGELCHLDFTIWAVYR